MRAQSQDESRQLAQNPLAKGQRKKVGGYKDFHVSFSHFTSPLHSPSSQPPPPQANLMHFKF
jgi:hypothetical protein